MTVPAFTSSAAKSEGSFQVGPVLCHWRKGATFLNEPNSPPVFEAHARPFAVAVEEDHAAILKRTAYR
jgi:hypothetical protein